MNVHEDHHATCLCCVALDSEDLGTGCNSCGYGGGERIYCKAGHFDSRADDRAGYGFDWHHETQRGATCRDFKGKLERRTNAEDDGDV